MDKSKFTDCELKLIKDAITYCRDNITDEYFKLESDLDCARALVKCLYIRKVFTTFDHRSLAEACLVKLGYKDLIEHGLSDIEMRYNALKLFLTLLLADGIVIDEADAKLRTFPGIGALASELNLWYELNK